MPKFENFPEQIISGVEEKSRKKMPTKKESILKSSPEEKTEQLWSLWTDYQRKKAELLRAEYGKQESLNTDDKKRIREEVEKDESLQRIEQAMADRFRDPNVQKLFKENLTRSLTERKKMLPKISDYRAEEEKMGNAQRTQEDLYREIFVHRNLEPDELTQLDLALTEAEIKGSKNRLEKSFENNPELAAQIQYRKIKEYHRQYEADKFIWTPSREKIFEEMMQHLVLLDQNRPMLLTGETGSGKTRMARAAAKRLTGKQAFEVGEEAKSDIRPLLGSQAIDKEGPYVTYGPAGQAFTGKKTSRDAESDGGGLFYMDEMNGYPPDALRSLIKQIAGRAPGEEVSFAAWRGQKEKLAERSGLLGSANLPSEKHPDRSALPVEVVRELTTIDVPYPEQTAENPEMYEMMLATLMDKNGRVRLKQGELEPVWLEKIVGDKKELILNLDAKVGGTLWRFANLVGEIQKSYKGEQNVLTPSKVDASYLEGAVLDPGIILGWLREYRISVLRKGVELRHFLVAKIKKWSSQPTFSKEDQKLIKDFCVEFGLPIEGDKVGESDAKLAKIFSEREIGFLSPRVPRLKEKEQEKEVEATPEGNVIFLDDGTEIKFKPSDEFVDKKYFWQDHGMDFRGRTEDGKLVFEEDGIGYVFTLEEFKDVEKQTQKKEFEKRFDDAGFVMRLLDGYIENKYKGDALRIAGAKARIEALDKEQKKAFARKLM